MDKEIGQELIHLVRDHRVAALGTLLDGHPLVTMVLFDPEPDLSGFDIHVSRLAQHTQAMAHNPKVALMIAESDSETRNPQTLARLAIQGYAEPLHTDGPLYLEARESYLQRFPKSAMNFDLGGFFLVRVRPVTARLVTGFGKIFDLSAAEMISLARQAHGLE
jgi:putative heme iron utilization protein